MTPFDTSLDIATMGQLPSVKNSQSSWSGHMRPKASCSTLTRTLKCINVQKVFSSDIVPLS